MAYYLLTKGLKPIKKGAMGEKFRVIDTPAGQAPEWVRKEWIGLELPISQSQLDEIGEEEGLSIGVLGGAPDSDNSGGYRVSGETALELLEKKSPEAARWWRLNAPYVVDMELVFGRKFCEPVFEEPTTPKQE